MGMVMIRWERLGIGKKRQRRIIEQRNKVSLGEE